MSESRNELRHHVHNLAQSYPIIGYDGYGNKSIVGTKCFLPQDLVDAIIDCSVAEAVIKVGELMKSSIEDIIKENENE